VVVLAGAVADDERPVVVLAGAVADDERAAEDPHAQSAAAASPIATWRPTAHSLRARATARRVTAALDWLTLSAR
jgi:hypothetical protein